MTRRKIPNRVFTPFALEPGDEPHVAELPRIYREAFNAVGDHEGGMGLRYDAAAVYLAVSIGTVKSRVSRAKDAIRAGRARAAKAARDVAE